MLLISATPETFPLLMRTNAGLNNKFFCSADPLETEGQIFTSKSSFLMSTKQQKQKNILYEEINN